MTQKLTIVKLLIFVISINLFAQKTKVNYFNNNKISLQHWYGKDQKKDSVSVFYRSGAINEKFYYDDDEKFHGKCFKYTNKGKVMTEWSFYHGKLISRKDKNLEYTSKNKPYVLEKIEKIKFINDVILKNPENQKFYLARAQYRSHLNNLVLAENDLSRYRKILEQNTSDNFLTRKKLSNCYDNLASVYFKMGDQENSLHYHFEAYKQMPVDGRLSYNLGSGFSFYKYSDFALHYLNKTISKAPKHTFANWGLARTYLDLGNYNKALTHINVCFNNEETLHKLTTGASNKGIRTVRGIANYHLNNLKESKKDFLDAISIKQDNGLAMFYISKIYEKQQKVKKAEKWLKKAEENNYTSTNTEASKKQIFELYPNIIESLNEQSTILKNYTKGDYLYTVYDLRDNLIIADKCKENVFNFSTLNNGTYKLRIETESTPIEIIFIVDVKDEKLYNELNAEKKKNKRKKIK